MPSALSFPGIYIEEIPSGVRTITGVSTSNTAFVDYFVRGPLNQAVRITSFADFERVFGGVQRDSEASYAIKQYYLNGGSVAFVVRVAAGTVGKAFVELKSAPPDEAPTLKITAASEGEWANDAVQVAVVPTTSGRFNLFVREVAVQDGSVLLENGQPRVLASEAFHNLSMDATSPDYVVAALGDSELVDADDLDVGDPPAGQPGDASGGPAGPSAWKPLDGGANGTPPTASAELLGSEAAGSGLFALDAIAPEVFNILCLPAAATMNDTNLKASYDAALAYCIAKRAFLLVDIPKSVNTPAEMVAQLGKVTTHNHAATYFPRLLQSDPLNNGRTRDVAASGTMAGVFARTDATRGVWKAPAGTEAQLRGVDLTTVISDGQNGGLNPLGLNVLRNFPIFGNIAWGARTLDGADQKASEWKYIPVRRTALFIEESLFQALKWVVFEPNDEPLWAQIRLNVGSFMNDLFRQGAFQGGTPRDAYFVKCDKETTTQSDINRGVVNVAVGFAPLKPAEFVVIRIQQIAGQLQV